ncbi:MAG: guanylate kinase, partial [Lachnospiraceae bacterium]
TETAEVIARRMTRAVEESKGIADYDYIVVNDDVDTCVEDIVSIVRAAKHKPVLNKEFIETTRNELKEFC